MTMQITTFRAVAERYASIMGRQGAASIAFAGKVPASKGNRIVLPSLPPGTVLTEADALIFAGWLDHETAHLRYTFREPGPEMNILTLEGLLYNLFEDIRIERKMIEEYPGTRRYLDAIAEKAFSEAKINHAERAHMLLVLVLKELYTKHRGLQNAPLLEDLRDNPQTTELIPLLAKLAGRMKTRQDAHDNAVELAEALKKLMEEPPPPPPSKKSKGQKGTGQKGKNNGDPGKPGDPGQGGRGEADPEDDGRGEEGGGGSGEESEDGGDPRSGSGGDNEERTGKNQQQPGDGEELSEEEIEEILTEAAKLIDRHEILERIVTALIKEAQKPDSGNPSGSTKRKHQRMGGSKILPPYTTDQDRETIWSKENPREYARLKAELTNDVNAAKRNLSTFLMSRDRRAWDRGLEEGVLDSRRVALLRAGVTAVFKEKRDRIMVNTDVELVVDWSGSMDADNARQAMIVVAEAVAAVPHIRLRIWAFTSDGSISLPPGESGKGYGRASPLHFHILKEYGEPFGKITARIGGFRAGMGSTPLGDAYARGCESIMEQPGPRKILWLVSDGEPSIYRHDDDHSEEELMMKVKRRCRRLGIETVGLEVTSHGGGALKPYVDRHANVTSTEELVPAVLTITRSAFNG